MQEEISWRKPVLKYEEFLAKSPVRRGWCATEVAQTGSLARISPDKLSTMISVWLWFSNGFPQRGFLQTSVSKMFSLFFFFCFCKGFSTTISRHESKIKDFCQSHFRFYTCFTWTTSRVFSQQGVLKINGVSEFVFNKMIGPRRCLKYVTKSSGIKSPFSLYKHLIEMILRKKVTMCVHVFSGESHENFLKFLISELWTQFFHKGLPLTPHAQKQTQLFKTALSTLSGLADLSSHCLGFPQSTHNPPQTQKEPQIHPKVPQIPPAKSPSKSPTDVFG